MSVHTDDVNLSDDEIFFGRLTLKEIKKHVHPVKKRQTVACNNTSFHDNGNDSIKIIETHSAPNISSSNIPVCLSPGTLSLSASPDFLTKWDIRDSNDSFLKIEKMVENICVSPNRKGNTDELNNTLDVVEYILNNGSNSANQNVITNENHSDGREVKEFEPTISANEGCELTSDIKNRKVEITPRTENNATSKEPDFLNVNIMPTSDFNTYHTPDKKYVKSENNIINSTSVTGLKAKQPMFKTPKNVVHKKSSGTPLKKQFQHVVSPVASYIKNSPVVPLLKNVRPMKPLPGASLIPQPVKSTHTNIACNKENQNLPNIAYRSAKETKVIDFPDQHKFPQSQWAKQIASSIPKGVVMKHIHREAGCVKKPLVLSQQEDSFNDLSLYQADLSVCTKKTSTNKPARIM